MARTAYPTDADVLDALGSLPGAPDIGSAHVGQAEAARIEFETLTGWSLVGSAVERKYAKPVLTAQGVLAMFDVPLLISGSQVAYKYDYVLQTTTTLTYQTDYEWLPVDYAPAFAQGILALTEKANDLLLIDGRWGSAQTVPEDIWQAVLAQAMGHTLRTLQGFQGEVTETKTGDVAIKFGNSITNSAIQRFESLFKSTVNRYMRII